MSAFGLQPQGYLDRPWRAGLGDFNPGINARRLVSTGKKAIFEGKKPFGYKHLSCPRGHASWKKRVLFVARAGLPPEVNAEELDGRGRASGEVPEVREAISSRPLKVFMRCAHARELGAAIVSWPTVHSLAFGGEGKAVTVEVTDAGGFYASLGRFLAENDIGLEILNPLDDNLAAVFQYLVA